MKKILCLPALLLVVAVTSGCNQEPPASAPAIKSPQTEGEKQAYAVGARMAQSHKKVIDDISEVQGTFDVDMYMMGIEDTIKDEAKFTPEELQTVSDGFRKEYLAKKRLISEKKKAEAKKVANEFLDKNKLADDVVTTESGLQYKVIKPGDGKKPEDGFRVKVLYTGKLINGEVFDTTAPDNDPREFQLNRVVQGWKEGLKLMTEGSIFEFYIPPALGYGDRDNDKIPAGSVLIFEVELIETFKPDPKKLNDIDIQRKMNNMPAGHP
ncbi:MAG: FKBP-type peptidyl-prolyl cis-trans isomerase [Cellvibrionaceae bacterium]|nr:FKBP-type peptidyl-prolyl cis-trans isomerase [Cellvibrionaceae bacterium]